MPLPQRSRGSGRRPTSVPGCVPRAFRMPPVIEAVDPALTDLANQVELPVLAWVPSDDLPETDGEPLETLWHLRAMMLLIESVSQYWPDRSDFFAGGNTFIYYARKRPRTLLCRGPDFFLVWGVDRYRPRRYWEVYKEGGKYPNVIIELTSPKTAKTDHTTK